MPCSALSAVCLRSSSIQPCRVSTIMSSWHRPPFSTATASSQRRTSGSWPRSRTKRGNSRRAYGNSTSRTKEMLLVVPSMSVRIRGFAMPALSPKSGGRGWFLVAREPLGDVRPGEVADPAVRLLEEADRDEARLRTHVEPVGGAVRDRDQVVAAALDLVHLVPDVQGEQARAVHEEAHLVLLVVVLLEEGGARLFPVRVVRADADHVHGGEAAFGADPVDVRLVGGEHLLGRGDGGDGRRGRPALEAQADLRQLARDLVAVVAGELGGGRVVLGEDAEAAHGSVSRKRGDERLRLAFRRAWGSPVAERGCSASAT